MGRGDGAGGHILYQVEFRNVSATTCVLTGYPSVTARESGQPEVTGQDGSFFPVDTSADMAPGEATFLGLETDTYCAARPDGGGGGRPYHHVDIEVPGGVVTVEAAEGLDVTCGLHLTRFFVPQPERSEPSTPPHRLTATLEAPDSVAAGATLVYVVALTNPADQPASLDPCPAYIQSAAPPAAVKDVEALNCAPAGTIPAHSSVRFEMRMPIPDDTAAGQLKIYWYLLGPNVSGEAAAYLTVTADSSG